MSSCKTKKNRKKLNKRKQNAITKLFDKLRDDCYPNNSNSDSILIIDDTMNISSINNTIVIKDDDDDTGSPQRNKSSMQCSTPKEISRPSRLNISSLSNINKEEIVQIDEDNDLTKQINEDSYLTIDLTSESSPSIAKENTVIDLAVSGASLVTSDDSEVTVINAYETEKRNENRLKKITEGIARMNSTEKGKLLELITQSIFNGCQVANRKSLSKIKIPADKTTETLEDTYIKEVILEKKFSHNSIGSNIYNPHRDPKFKTGLRMIVIDGSNVAMQHTQGKIFSVMGLKICIEYFLQRGHIVKAFVPQFRCKFNKSSHPRLLDEMRNQGHVIYTPSRETSSKFICSYDDRYIIQCAAEFDGVIVTSDNYKDLINENPRWKFVIENRILPFTWVGDMIIFPKDPLGRHGPTLEQFLRHTT